MNDSPEHTAEAGSETPVAAPTEPPAPTAQAQPPAQQADLKRIEADLAGVETALDRLDAGTYWSDEVTGDPIPDEILIADPVARRSS